MLFKVTQDKFTEADFIVIQIRIDDILKAIAREKDMGKKFTLIARYKEKATAYNILSGHKCFDLDYVPTISELRSFGYNV